MTDKQTGKIYLTVDTSSDDGGSIWVYSGIGFYIWQGDWIGSQTASGSFVGSYSGSCNGVTGAALANAWCRAGVGLIIHQYDAATGAYQQVLGQRRDDFFYDHAYGLNDGDSGSNLSVSNSYYYLNSLTFARSSVYLFWLYTYLHTKNTGGGNIFGSWSDAVGVIDMDVTELQVVLIGNND